MEKELLGKVALITGASSGIGAATAVLFASHGCSLMLAGRNKERLEAVKNECIEKSTGGQQIITFQADLTVSSELISVFDELQNLFGKLDILVNNAGIPAGYDKFDVHEQLRSFDNIFNLNVRSLVYLSELAIPLLQKSKGNIVNVSSVASRAITTTSPGARIYGTSKAAVDKFTKQMAASFGSDGVRVNAVNPGSILTPLVELLKLPLEKYEENVRRLHPFGRPGTSEDVARAILFLASDDARCITGVLHSLDTGAYVQPGQMLTN